MKTAFNEMAIAFLDTLTTPEAEDWLVIVNRDEVLLSCIREHGGRVEMAQERSPLAEFKKAVCTLQNEPRQLGRIDLIWPTDAEERGAAEVLSFLKKLAPEKNFSLTTMLGAASTVEAIDAAEQYGGPEPAA